VEVNVPGSRAGPGLAGDANASRGRRWLVANRWVSWDLVVIYSIILRRHGALACQAPHGNSDSVRRARPPAGIRRRHRKPFVLRGVSALMFGSAISRSRRRKPAAWAQHPRSLSAITLVFVDGEGLISRSWRMIRRSSQSRVRHLLGGKSLAETRVLNAWTRCVGQRRVEAREFEHSRRSVQWPDRALPVGPTQYRRAEDQDVGTPARSGGRARVSQFSAQVRRDGGRTPQPERRGMIAGTSVATVEIAFVLVRGKNRYLRLT